MAGIMSGCPCDETCSQGGLRSALAAYARRVGSAVRRLLYLGRDVAAVVAADPALRASPVRYPEVALYAGVWALLFHRIAHLLSSIGVPFIPRLLSQIARMATGVEIHPGATIGPGLFIDHGMGVVIGETAIVGAGVVMYHGVTLGGTGHETGKRHPTVGDHVTIGAGAAVLGNITIGDDSRIGAQAVVLADVPAGATAVGVPARVIPRRTSSAAPHPSR